MNSARYASVALGMGLLVISPPPASSLALTPGPAWSFQSNQSTANLGATVTTAGDVNGDGYSDVLVAAPKFNHPESDEGSVFVFHGSPQGPSLTPSWTADGNVNDFQFGSAAAAAGDVNGDGYGDVIVGGAQLSNGQNQEGRACVYLGSPAGLGALPAWTYESNQAFASFGISVAPAGDVNGDGYGDVIVGASGYSNGQLGEGRAFVFLGSAAGLALAPSWTAENNRADSRFGQSVCTAGDVNGDGYSDVLIGAHYYTNNETQEGAAYCYYGSAAGLALAPSWIAESNQLQAYFGTSVSTAGDVNGDGYADVIVGANQWDTNLAEEGRAFVYLGGPFGLAGGAAWVADGGAGAAFFGGSVATAGDVNDDGYADVIVGAKRLLAFTGTARVFLGSALGLSVTPAWSTLGALAGDWYGASVGTAGDVNGDGLADVIVGAPSVSAPEELEGAAFVYLGRPSGLSATPQRTLVLEEVSAGARPITGSAGDVNGDGFGDRFVGRPDAPDFANPVGRLDVYYGSPAGGSVVPDWSVNGAAGELRLGSSAASAGDVDGDGYSDLIVGGQGFAHVFLGSPTGLAAVSAWTATGDGSFGTSVSSAGDVNGDGFADIVVGAPAAGGHGVSYGAAYLWYGSATGLGASTTSDEAPWHVEGNAQLDFVGAAVGSAGDVNGDGFSDLFVAASCHAAFDFAGFCMQTGRLSIYYGHPQGPDSVADWSALGVDRGDAFDIPAGRAGDVNGDGYSDVFAVSRIRLPPYDDEVHIWYGSAQGLGATGTLSNADDVLTSDQLEDGFGQSVECAGDVNGDGFTDLIVGALAYDIDGPDDSNDGRAFVFHGSPNGMQNPADWSSESFGDGQLIGRSLGGVGDVNGDGLADFSIIDRGDLATFANAHLWFGNGGGPTRQPRQQRSDSVTPIAPLGLSGAGMSAVFSAHARSAFGRTRAKLEWEVKPFGTPLNGAGTKRNPNWSDTGVGGARVAALDAQLPATPLQHWRARLRFDAAKTPFAPPSRWFTVPMNGWNEADYRLWPAASAVGPRSGGPPAARLELRAAPHPLRPGARISFELLRRASVELSLHDVTGARRLQMPSGLLEPGTHELAWSGQDDSGRALAPGVYFLHVRMDGRPASQHKVVVLK